MFLRIGGYFSSSFSFLKSVNIEGSFWHVNAGKYLKWDWFLFAHLFIAIYIRRAMRSEGNKDSKHWLSELPFTRTNYILFIAGLFVIILGYILMGTGELNSIQSLSVSPIVLLIGYLVIIPVAILYKNKDKDLWYFWDRSSVWLERRPVKPEVAGSSPVGPAKSS